MVRGTFSPARAWRPAVVSRLARTLGLAVRLVFPLGASAISVASDSGSRTLGVLQESVESRLAHLEMLVNRVSFAQAACAAQSVQSKPPQAAYGNSRTHSINCRALPSSYIDSKAPHMGQKHPVWPLPSFWSSGPFLVLGARTGPVGTQRLLCRHAGSGVGAEYAPTPRTFSHQARPAHKPHEHAFTRLRRQ